MPLQWKIYETLLFSGNSDDSTDKYACFDLDGTIVCSMSGTKYIKNKEDWKFKYDTVKEVMHIYKNKNYRIVIFTNQAGIKLVGIDNWKAIISNIVANLGIDIDIYVATNYDLYRKPFPSMWNMYVANKQVNVKSFYCGDACGRTDDFSDSDYKFALNCNLRFYTPDELFKKTKYFERPKILYNVNFKKYMMVENPDIDILPHDIIVLVGNYASGKTHFMNRYLLPNGYVCSDSHIQKLIDSGKSIVVDDIHLGKKDRKKYIELAKQNNYTCRCINIVCPISMAIHNSRYRHLVTNGKCKIISDEIINQYRDRFECPMKDEGFDDVIKYNFEIDTSVNISKYMLFLF